MKYVHIRKLEKYHPGYKDRTLIWCKTYFSMINSDVDFEMLCEIDKWRFICFVMLEIQMQKPVPLDENYLIRKGFSLEHRPISKTLNMLQKFIEVCNTDVTDNKKVCDENVTQSRVEKSREEEICVFFNKFWELYPRKIEKKKTEEIFHNKIREKDFEDLEKAVKNYVSHTEDSDPKFIKHPSTWLETWDDWVSMEESLPKVDLDLKMNSTGLYQTLNKGVCRYLFTFETLEEYEEYKNDESKLEELKSSLQETNIGG